MDDLLAIRDAARVANFNANREKRFEIRGYGELDCFLGVEIKRNVKAKTLCLTNTMMIEALMVRFGLTATHVPPTMAHDAPLVNVDDDDTKPHHTESVAWWAA